MFCTQCGEERQSEDIYCGHCGHRVGNEPQQRPQERYIDLQVVGVRYSNTDGNQRQKIIQHLKEGQNIQLHREPHNPHDSNAIRVETLDGQQFGYIAREIALLYANSLDHRSLSTWPGQVKKIAGEVYGNDPVRGVIITIKVPPGSDATDAPSLTTRVPSRSAVPAPGSTINHDARTWHDVWNAHYRDGNYRKAVEAGKKAVELDTENAGLWKIGRAHV